MKNIAELLVNENIIRTNFEEPFTWTSGLRSPVYIDCRELISIPHARKEIVDELVRQIKTLPYETAYIAGTATAGIPWAAFVAQELGLPMLYVRGKPKGYGAGKMVEGRGEQGKHIVVVEDVFSTAGSSITSANALRNELKATVQDIFATFSYDMPITQENAKEANLTLHPLTTFSELGEVLLSTGKISAEEKAELEQFHDNPKEWWKE